MATVTGNFSHHACMVHIHVRNSHAHIIDHTHHANDTMPLALQSMQYGLYTESGASVKQFHASDNMYIRTFWMQQFH